MRAERPEDSPRRWEGEIAMHDLDEFTVTEAALAQMATTANPRLKEIMDAAVRHLHAFAREVNLTPAEWLQGIGFLTEVGHMCTPVRAEFILLSDVMGLSALVNALHNKTALEKGTDTSLLGPFYREDAPKLQPGDSILSGTTAQEIVVYGRVVDKDGKGIPGATIQVWQTDDHGQYDLQIADGGQMDMRGSFTTDAEGKYFFRTVRPLGYMIPMDGPVGTLVTAQGRHGYRPSHIHFLVGCDGFRELVTALYFADDDHIDSDTVFGVSRSLVVNAKADPAAPLNLPALHYDFQLSRAAEAGESRVGSDPSKLVKAAE
jgi:hydroxyquinol 1,2-dioxygenase